MCDCIFETDKMLAEHNTTLVTTLFSNPMRCTVRTDQLQTGRGKQKAATMLASFCPFCGESYDAAKAEAA
jgi:hypothetical protein